MSYLVYRLLNRRTGKSYIGMTKQTVDKRWSQHQRMAAKGADFPLHRSIRKHGSDCWTVTVLYTSKSRSKAGYAEQRYIDVHETRAPRHGYNVAPGGVGGDVGDVGNKKRSRTLKLLHLMNEIPKVKREPQSAERRQAQSVRMKGNQHAKGNVQSEWVRTVVSDTHKGVPKSLEMRKKLSETRRRLGLGSTSGTKGMVWVVNKRGQKFCVKNDDPKINSPQFQRGMKWREHEDRQ